jgi:hypothetical protein
LADATYSAAFRIKIEDASKLSPDDAQRLLKVRSITVPTDAPYESRGRIIGLACSLGLFFPVWLPPVSEANGETPEGVALQQLRVKTVRAGGNAMLEASCVHSNSIDWANNCFESWICTGEAIRLAE